MKSSIKCLPCFVEQGCKIASMVTDDEKKQEEVIRKILRLTSEISLDKTPPSVAKEIHNIIYNITNESDPYKELKDKSNEIAEDILPTFEKEVENSDKKFALIIKLIIAGNTIDYGANKNFNLDNKLIDIFHEAIKEYDLNPDSLDLMENKMNAADNILYIMDNCGEAVFDKLLLERYKEKITAVVRGGPILNDITMREAEKIGITDLVNVITTGENTPGVTMEDTSDEFKKALDKADLVIAKGQGNYESLSNIQKPAFFILRVKCPVVAKDINAPTGEPVITTGNL